MGSLLKSQKVDWGGSRLEGVGESKRVAEIS